MDYEFGSPTSDYYNVAESVFARQFQNATVIANISSSTNSTVVIDGDSYELAARSALIV